MTAEHTITEKQRRALRSAAAGVAWALGQKRRPAIGEIRALLDAVHALPGMGPELTHR